MTISTEPLSEIALLVATALAIVGTSAALMARRLRLSESPGFAGKARRYRAVVLRPRKQNVKERTQRK